jgi:hypothetical protein
MCRAAAFERLGTLSDIYLGLEEPQSKSKLFCLQRIIRNEISWQCCQHDDREMNLE